MTPESASTMEYAFVTTHVCKALERVDGPRFENENRRALEKGAEFLGELRRGAFWVGGGSIDLGYSASTIPVSSRALSTLSALHLITREEEAQAVLNQLAESLQQLARDGTPSIPVETLRNFFRMLSKRFASEASAASFGEGLEHGHARRS